MAPIEIPPAADGRDITGIVASTGVATLQAAPTPGHGHAHGTELPAGQDALLYSIGFVIATGCLHALGIGIGSVHRWSWGQRALRVAGAVVCLGGAFFMWKAVA